MQLKEGEIVECKVTGITNYGAFVKIADDINGMIHISEISLYFVKDINEHIEIDQVVRAVVMSIGKDGKVSLSIKRLKQFENGEHTANPQSKSPEEYKKPGKTSKNTGSFEDMMNKFKQDSEEKMSSLKNFEPKKNNFTRKKTYQNNQNNRDN